METDDLYALPLEEFVRERDALAKRLRTSGDRVEADSVKKLAKPSRAAWAVNQLMRSQPKARRELVEAGEAAQRAGSRLGGSDAGDELRLAATAGSRAVRDLLKAARGLADGQGRSLADQSLQAVESTLQVALVDPEAREAVAEARLSRELAATGFPSIGLSGPAPAAKRSSPRAKAARKPAARRGPSPAAIAKARDAVKRAKADLRTRERAERQTRDAADRATRAAERAREALAKAEKRADDLDSSG